MKQLRRSDYAVRSENYGQSIGIDQAEAMRQKNNLTELRVHNEELFKRVFGAQLQVAQTEQLWAEVRAELTAAVPPGQVGDVIKAIKDEVAEFLKEQTKPTAA